jgi:hypothetical protein
MPAVKPPNRAPELERLIAELTGHTAARVRPYGKHLLIQVQRDDSLDTVARLTESARDSYTAAFRSHSGRWEPLPVAGSMHNVTAAVVSMLAPYLDPGM